jgi:ligand-binding sensor domain-containing protein
MLCVRAQPFPDIQFSYLTAKDGLSNNNTNWIAQDNDGFMWFGTNDGLNRYDGYRIRKYYHIASDGNSLFDNSISQIVPGKKNHLWIATREGVCVYDKLTGQFQNLKHNTSDTNDLRNDGFARIYSDQDGISWVTTGRGIYMIDSNYRSKKIDVGFKNFYFNKELTTCYYNIFVDRQNNLWSHAKNMLYLLDKNTKRIKKTFAGPDGDITSFFQDSNGQYWVGSFGKGLMNFDLEKSSFTIVKLNSPTTVVNSVSEWRDQNGARWIVVGSDISLILVDPASLANKEYGYHQGFLQQHFLPGNNVMDVFVDKQNILWVATDGGVCFVEPTRQLFQLWNIYTPKELVTESLTDNVYSCAENKTNFWMTSWLRPGLYVYDKSGNIVKKVSSLYTSKLEAPVLDDTLKAYYLFFKGDSTLWITTNVSLIKYNVFSGVAKEFKPPDVYDFTGLRTILQYDDHTWWIRTRNNGSNGIYIFDPLQGKFTKHFRYSPGCNGCVPPNLMCMTITSKKQVYLGSRDGGLYNFDSASGGFINTFTFPPNDEQRHSNTFLSLAEDKQGILWIGTNTGLINFDPVLKKITKDFTTDGVMGGCAVNAILFDEQQNAWLNTERGIFCIVRSTGQIKQFSTGEGLPNDYAQGVLKEGQDHFIYSCIAGYMVRIQPTELTNNYHRKAAVHFSEATIMDAPAFFYTSSSGKKQLVIEPGQTRFALDFSVMNYDITRNNRYYYKLDGAMNTWQQNENGHLAFYNLSPGEYTLHIKGGDKYNSLVSDEEEVTIIVRPHWWQTTWFKLICVAFVALLTAWILQRRIVAIRREASFKQRIAETEMMALRSQMNPHFIFNSLNSIENFMMQNEKRLASNYLNKFARLIRMILDSSRNELVPITKDMEALKLYVDLEQLRFNNKFSFSLQLDHLLKQGDYRVPSLLIQPYVENAVVHGLAHSENEGLKLTVAAYLDGDFINYIIEDNGVGRKLASVYNKQNKPHHKSVGLKITEERIHVFNQQQGANSKVAITDLYDEHQNPTGTRVEITLKAV